MLLYSIIEKERKQREKQTFQLQFRNVLANVQRTRGQKSVKQV